MIDQRNPTMDVYLWNKNSNETDDSSEKKHCTRKRRGVSTRC